MSEEKLYRFSRSCVERMAKTWAMICEGRRQIDATILAKEFECSTKTIWRDMEFMRERLGLPIRYDGHQRTYVADDASILPWWLKLPRPGGPAEGAPNV